MDSLTSGEIEYVSVSATRNLVENGVELTKNVMNLINERAKIELEYSKKLYKWLKLTRSTVLDKPHQFIMQYWLNLITSICKEADVTANQHYGIYERLYNKAGPLNILHDWLSNSSTSKSNIKQFKNFILTEYDREKKVKLLLGHYKTCIKNFRQKLNTHGSELSGFSPKKLLLLLKDNSFNNRSFVDLEKSANDAKESIGFYLPNIISNEAERAEILSIAVEKYLSIISALGISLHKLIDFPKGISENINSWKQRNIVVVFVPSATNLKKSSSLIGDHNLTQDTISSLPKDFTYNSKEHLSDSINYDLKTKLDKVNSIGFPGKRKNQEKKRNISRKTRKRSPLTITRTDVEDSKIRYSCCQEQNHKNMTSYFTNPINQVNNQQLSSTNLLKKSDINRNYQKNIPDLKTNIGLIKRDHERRTIFKSDNDISLQSLSSA